MKKLGKKLWKKSRNMIVRLHFFLERYKQKETAQNYKQIVLCGHALRVTGLEPVRRETHAPQTCLSASSSTLANVQPDTVSIIPTADSFVKTF